MRLLAIPLVSAWLAVPLPANANPLCSWLGICMYLSPGFELTVVDAETGKPLPGVYGWAEWVQYGAHGTGGPLVVQDAFSDASGRLTFPRWGPTWGSRGGLPVGRDPALILFKSGYATLVVFNGPSGGASHRALIRGYRRSGETVKLQAFHGSADDWVEHIQKLVYPAIHGYVTNAHRDQYSALYLRRAGIAVVELGKLSPHTDEAAVLLRALNRSMPFYRGEE